MGCFIFHKRRRPAAPAVTPTVARPPVLTKAASSVGSTPVPLPQPSPTKRPLPLPRPLVPEPPPPMPSVSPPRRRRGLRSFDFEQLCRASPDSRCGASTNVVVTGDGVQTVDVFPINASSGPKDWLTRAEALAQLEHPNLCRLLGFAIGGSVSFLHLAVYERPEGCQSLDKALMPGSLSTPGWAARLRIALGVCKALGHLQDSLPIDDPAKRRPTWFPDARNVLVSRDGGVVKLAGYGLHLLGQQQDACAEEREQEQEEHGHAIRSQDAAKVMPEPPRPSMADETRPFGALLLELLTGRSGVHLLLPGGVADLVQWGRPILGDAAKLSNILDPKLAPYVRRHPHATIAAAREVANLALSCLHTDPRLRPTMRRATASLAALVDALPLDDDTSRMRRSATFSSKATDSAFQVRSANGSPARMRTPDRPRFLSPDRSRIRYDHIIARLRQTPSPGLRRLQTLQPTTT